MNCPEKFGTEVLGVDYTPDQLKVLASMVEKPKGTTRISVKSGHGVGKSFLAATTALWFKYCFTPSIVLTTAPTERQVKQILWREIRARHSTSKQPLAGKPLTMSLDLGPKDYMLGFSTNDVQQMQGFHSPNIMVIIDEANGYPEELFHAIEGLVSGGERVILFQIGNPIKPLGPFCDSFKDGMTIAHTISCMTHPNVVSGKNIIPGAVTKEWVDRMVSLWGLDSSFVQSRVFGKFPTTADDVVINLNWVETAELLEVTCNAKGDDLYMGVDCGEYGADDYVWYVGSKRARKEIVAKRNIEPSECIGITKQLKIKYAIPDENITVDGIGAGASIYSVLKSDGINCNRFVSSESAKDTESFADAVTESYWNLRTLLNPGSDYYGKGYSFVGRVDRLKADLCTRKYHTDRHGKLKLEPKEEYRKRMKRSPDYADAMAFAYSFMSKRKTYGFIALPDAY